MGANEKASAAWHPRPCPPGQCRFCGRTFGTDDVTAIHESKCIERVEDGK